MNPLTAKRLIPLGMLFFCALSCSSPSIRSRISRGIASDQNRQIRASTRILVISDLSNTLRIPRSDSSNARLARPGTGGTSFCGMPDLYRTLQRDQPEVRFHYLSNTREHSRAESLVKRFLRTNGFPAGELDLRNGLSRKEFKQDIIRALILEHRPEDVICIGNNAGQDVRVFQEMTEELGLRVRFHVFIHRISFCPPGSDQNPQLGQIGYVTPIELAMSLENQGLLRKKSVTRLARKLISRPPEASRLKRALAERCSGPAPRSER